MGKQPLGKGLESLLSSKVYRDGIGQAVQMLAVSQIHPNRNQPRKVFAQEDLERLADSIQNHGLLQPLVVRRLSKGGVEVIAGERRLRAAQLANLSEVPVVIRYSSDDEATILAIVENIQRTNLNPMEESRAYHRLLNEFGLTQELLAQKVGRERSSVANICRLVSLPVEVQSMVEAEQLTLGHAKVLMGLSDHDEQLLLARKIQQGKLSVRQTEQWGKQTKSKMKSKLNNASKTRFHRIEKQLRQYLQTEIDIRQRKQGGEIALRYQSNEDLARLANLILS